jgi:hypothetical protein
MYKYKVTEDFLSLSEGQFLKLSEAQIKRRKSLLSLVKRNGLCKVILPFHLKKDEIFETEDAIGKELSNSVELIQDNATIT